MKRKKFIGLAGVSLLTMGSAGYFFSDRRDFIRKSETNVKGNFPFMPGEREILSLASLAPSGHNTQPWSVHYVGPYHWIICNDNSKWLPAVDPDQRETVLSIGAFVQTLEYAANSLGYTCDFNMLATSNQQNEMIEVKLTEAGGVPDFDAGKIRMRRTVRSGYSLDIIRKEDIDFITNGEASCYFFPNSAREYKWLNDQTIEANRLQAFRDDAQAELSKWMRFSSTDASRYLDGITTASLELASAEAWFMRNFYSRKEVMNLRFRKQGIERVRDQVARSGGWLLITSKDQTTRTLLETGRLMQRVFLRIREKNIGFHPMTQILEEAETSRDLNTATGLKQPVQFMLRVGYLKDYPDPVSLRRPVESLLKNRHA